jgi:membrane-associated phospholipid phosphatase
MDYNVDFIKFIDTLGQNGPFINFFITSVNLLSQKKYLISFLVCVFINHFLNGILKLTIREPRPGQPKANESEKMINLVGNQDKYGMPSYHAQSVFFATTFLYLVQKNPAMLFLESVICTITLYQRFKYKMHDMRQLAVGSFIGISFAFLCFTLTNQYLSKQ